MPATATHPTGVPSNTLVDAAADHHAAPAPTATAPPVAAPIVFSTGAGIRPLVLVVVVRDHDDPRPLTRRLGDEVASLRSGSAAGLAHAHSPCADVPVRKTKPKWRMHRDGRTAARIGAIGGRARRQRLSLPLSMVAVGQRVVVR